MPLTLLFAEMASTGEVAAFGRNVQEAFFNATMSVNGFKLPKAGSGVLVGGDIDRPELGLVAKGLSDLGFKIFCSSSAVEEHLNSIPYLVNPPATMCLLQKRFTDSLFCCSPLPRSSSQ